MQLFSTHKEKMDVIHSAGDFNGFEMPNRKSDEPLMAGYLGSLNFAKLHPRYVEFLAAIDLPDFTIRMIGDIVSRDVLEKQSREAGHPDMFEFRGYTADVASELADINILPYILNPQHYGTTENALLEAMSMGVVPIVLNNPAERALVINRKTGLIVRTPQEFGDAVTWLANHPESRQRIAREAAQSIRNNFVVRKMSEAFNRHYTSSCEVDKTVIPFTTIFGKSPAEWFLACQRHPEYFTTDYKLSLIDEFTLPGLIEQSKGSIFQYHKYFPKEERLSQWAQRLEALE